MLFGDEYGFGLTWTRGYHGAPFGRVMCSLAVRTHEHDEYPRCANSNGGPSEPLAGSSRANCTNSAGDAES